MGYVGRRGPQRRKPHVMEEASRSGIFAVRRRIAPVSHEVFETILNSIGPELINAGRPFKPDSLGVTIIGFSRFDKSSRHKGPSVAEISKGIPSALAPLRCRLGELAVFGSGTKHKLGYSLEGDELRSEVEAFENAYADRGVRLKPDPNNPNGEANPHCSFALLYNDHAEHFREDETLARLTALSLGSVGANAEVVLEPVPA